MCVCWAVMSSSSAVFVCPVHKFAFVWIFFCMHMSLNYTTTTPAATVNVCYFYYLYNFRNKYVRTTIIRIGKNLFMLFYLLIILEAWTLAFIWICCMFDQLMHTNAVCYAHVTSRVCARLMQVTACNMLGVDMGQVFSVWMWFYDGMIVYQGVKLEMWQSN